MPGAPGKYSIYGASPHFLYSIGPLAVWHISDFASYSALVLLSQLFPDILFATQHVMMQSTTTMTTINAINPPDSTKGTSFS